MPLLDHLKTKGALIEERLRTLIPKDSFASVKLIDAAHYSLLGGGKRLRPILAMTTAEVLGAPSEAALTPACALEMIHTYSLIHDDLPCMDDDDFRRGKPSLHKAYNEGLAVLTGDFLLTYAFEVIATDDKLSPSQKVKLIELLAKRAGGSGMIAGQVMDIAAEGKVIDLGLLQQIHNYKTAAMISASVEFGAVVADLDEGECALLRKFGYEIGLAFQIIDDVLDVTSSEKKHGKKVASDSINEKTTYASLLGIERAEAMAKQCYQTSLQTLAQLPYDTAPLTELASRLVFRDY